MKTFKLTINEGELKALINYHKMHIGDTSVETSSRIHDLTKRLNRDSAETETEVSNKTEPTPTQPGW